MFPDFSLLYSELGLRPGCSLEALKSAYHRRIAELHPDRRGDRPASARDEAVLRDLIALYGSAMRFHRQHGRLPGTAVEPRTEGGHSPGSRGAAASTPGIATEGRSEPAASTPRSGGPVLLTIAVVMVVLALWLDFGARTPSDDWHAIPEPEPIAAPTEFAERVREAGHETERDRDNDGETHLRLGMAEAAVREVQGQPILIRDDEWHYGPSWLRFERGRLADWYSSPLRRLKTRSETPTEENRRDANDG